MAEVNPGTGAPRGSTKGRQATEPTQNFRLFVFRVNTEFEDDFAAFLLEQGSLGSQVLTDGSNHVQFEAWFPSGARPGSAELGPWLERGIIPLDELEQEARDWLAEYRRQVRPFRIGRFWIDPRDPDTITSPPASSRLLPLRVPARNAFGTGSHETTRLLLRWLQDLPLEGLDVLDVGTGSAILSLAAMRLGAKRVIGFDIDTPSVCTARQNLTLNPPSSPSAHGLSTQPCLFAGTALALRQRPRFDLALVNVLPERIESDLGRLLATLKPAARILSSGNLTARRDELLERWRDLGMTLVEERNEGEWIAFLLHTDGAS